MPESESQNPAIPEIPKEFIARFGVNFDPTISRRVDYRFTPDGDIERLRKIVIQTRGRQHFRITLGLNIAVAIEDTKNETLTVGSWVMFQGHRDDKPRKLLDVKILDLKDSLLHSSDENVVISRGSDIAREVIYYYEAQQDASN